MPKGIKAVKPEKDVLYELYVVKRYSYREIMKIINVSSARSIKKWLVEYEIPIRTGGEAIKTQWENNSQRRKAQAKFSKKKFTGNTNRRLSSDYFSERFRKNDLELRKRFIEDNYSFFEVKCMICGHVFVKISKSIGDSGCGKCNSPKGEKRISEVLEELGCDYKREVKFDDCKDKARLRFDFGVYKEGQLLCLIEYDGVFHFGKKISGRNDFAGVLRRDKIKNDYCKKKNIKLIRICFINFENIKEILYSNLAEQPSLF